MLEDFEEMSKNLGELIEILSSFPEKGAKLAYDAIMEGFNKGKLENVKENSPNWKAKKERIYTNMPHVNPSSRGVSPQSGVFTGTMYSTINFTRNDSGNADEVIAKVGVLDTNAAQPKPFGKEVADYVPRFELYTRKKSTLNGYPVTAVIGYYVVKSVGDIRNALLTAIPRKIAVNKEERGMIAIK